MINKTCFLSEVCIFTVLLKIQTIYTLLKIEIMTKRNIRTIIEGCAKEAYNSYREPYINSLQLAKDYINSLAVSYWEHRNIHDIKRDNDVGITFDDYLSYCLNSYCEWLSDQIEMSDITNVQELFNFAGEDLEDTCDFNRDLRTDDIFHPSFELGIETSINFNFTITELDGFNSTILFNYCECV